MNLNKGLRTLEPGLESRKLKFFWREFLTQKLIKTQKNVLHLNSKFVLGSAKKKFRMLH